jgi:hypothetical protein
VQPAREGEAQPEVLHRRVVDPDDGDVAPRRLGAADREAEVDRRELLRAEDVTRARGEREGRRSGPDAEEEAEP